jgi:autotransporter adhesin
MFDHFPFHPRHIVGLIQRMPQSLPGPVRCALAIAVLTLATTPIMAGCNSGDVANTSLLSSADCQANASGGLGAVAIGYDAFAKGNEATSVGAGSGSGIAVVGATAIGYRAVGSEIYSTSVGWGAWSQSAYAIAIGGGNDIDFASARAVNDFGVAVGAGSLAVGVRSTAIGPFAGSGTDTGAGAYNSALGDRAGWFQSGAGNVAVGLLAGNTVQGDSNVAIGNASGGSVTGTSNVAIGISAGKNMTASYTVAVGASARAGASNSVAIGRDAAAVRPRSVALGQGSLANAADTVSVGSSSLRRRIVNVAPGVNANDAVNLAQLQAAMAALAAAASPAVVAMPAATDPPAVSVARVGDTGRGIEDMRRELSELRALVRQQQERIAALERRVVAAASAN